MLTNPTIETLKALKLYGLLEALEAQPLSKEVPQPRVRMHRRPLLEEGPGAVRKAPGEDAVAREGAPHLLDVLHPLRRGVTGVGGAVHRAHGGPVHAVRPDPACGELRQHAHLHRATASAAGQHERRARPLRLLRRISANAHDPGR